jgi:hypothetical protein
MLTRLTAQSLPPSAPSLPPVNERSSASTARTPASRSSPLTFRPPEQQHAASPAMRSLSFRQPSPAPRAPIHVPPPSEEEDEDDSFEGPSRALKTASPRIFEGLAKDKAQAHTWLRKTVGWLILTAPGESDTTLITLFTTALGDGPTKWLHNMQDQKRAKRERLTLQEVLDAFMKTYYGGVSEKMAEQQLNSLEYGKGECRDLVSLDSTFDRLAMELYPGAESSKAATSLLARIYSEAVRKGDPELWEKAMDTIPTTLDEWKVAVQNAYVVIETKKAHQVRPRHEVRTTFFSRSSPSTSTSSSSSSYRSNDAVQVKKAEVEEDSHDTPGEEGKEEVHRAEVSSAPRPPFRPTHERLGGHLSFQQREQLKLLNKCWICMKAGHRAFDCQFKGKPGYPRKPSAEDLKA